MLTNEERQFWRGFLAAEPGFAGDDIGNAVDRILAKIADYEDRNLHVRHALDELHLVCRYSEQALSADVAPGASRFDFAAFALRVARALANEHGVFNRVFLFNPNEAQKVLQVYPRPAKQNQRTT